MTAQVVITRTVSDYCSVVSTSSSAIPVLSEQSHLPGFPRAVEWISFEQWQSQPLLGRPFPKVDLARVCVVAGDDLCNAAGTLLATRTGRRLIRVETLTDVEGLTRRLVGESALTLTWICASWEKAEQPTPRFVREIVDALRRCAADLGCLSWGVVTGIDAPALTRMAAKSLLQEEIASEHRDNPALVFNLFDPRGTKSAIEPFRQAVRPAPIVAVDDRGESLGGTPSDEMKFAFSERWSLAVFKAHGRPYCAARGFLCGARRADEHIDSPPRSCVAQMDCAYPDWPRVDPRSVDAPVLMLDACGSGHLTSWIWNAGVPSIAFLAAHGGASAVISGDERTWNSFSDFVDMLWALQASATLGEAVRRLNAVRRPVGTTHLLYFLLGDPEIMAGARRWPRWATQAELQTDQSSSLPTWRVVDKEPPDSPGAPYVAIEGIPVDESTPIHLWADGGPPLLEARVFREDGRATLWFGQRAKDGRSFPIHLQLGQNAVLPKGLLKRAVDLNACTLPWWSALSALRGPCTDAAMAVIAAAAVEKPSSSTVVDAPSEVRTSAIRDAVSKWLQVHRLLIQTVVGTGIANPTYFWRSGTPVRGTELDQCPYCLQRLRYESTYDSFPSFRRRQSECLDCGAIDDRPETTEFPHITIDVPARIRGDQPVTATLAIDTRDCNSDWLGACAVVMDGGPHHGLTTSPSMLTVNQGNAIASYQFVLNRSSKPRRAHLYGVRAFTVLNGLWHACSRGTIVSG